MVYRTISADMKERALALLRDDWNIEETAETLGVCPKSITRWQHNFNTFGRVDPPSELRGRPRLLSSDVIQSLSELLADAPFVYLDEIQEWLALYHDSIISKTALHDNLQDLGFTRKVMHRITAERDDEARQHWLQHVITTYTADQMVVLDESSKDGRTLIRKYGRAYKGSEASTRTALQRGIRYSILPALTVDGYMAVRVVEGSIDGREFFDFMLHDVVCLPYSYPLYSCI
jgi:transposase